TCVRFDKHTVYLGTPGATQDCPANLVGRTEALLVQPSTAGGSSAVDDTGSDQINVATATAAITAPHRTPPPTPPPPLPPAAALPLTAPDATGEGFDACTAPAQAAMTSWKASTS